METTDPILPSLGSWPPPWPPRPDLDAAQPTTMPSLRWTSSMILAGEAKPESALLPQSRLGNSRRLDTQVQTLGSLPGGTALARLE